eukprot:scaffold2950_cov67-Phaeocystis_antarctica.AAC.8
MVLPSLSTARRAMSAPSTLQPLTEQSCSTTSFSLAASRQCSLEMSRGNAAESSMTSHSPLSLPIEMAWLSARPIAAGRSGRGCPLTSTRLQLVGMPPSASVYGTSARENKFWPGDTQPPLGQTPHREY